LGRRRKRYKRVVKKLKKIPDIYQCPHCSMKTLVIKFAKSKIPDYKIARIMCGSCGLYSELQVPNLYEAVDVYAKFIDLYDKGEVEIEFTKVVEEAGGTEAGGVGEKGS